MNNMKDNKTISVKLYFFTNNLPEKIDKRTACWAKGNLQVVTVHDTLYSHFDYSGNLYEDNDPNAKGGGNARVASWG